MITNFGELFTNIVHQKASKGDCSWTICEQGHVREEFAKKVLSKKNKILRSIFCWNVNNENWHEGQEYILTNPHLFIGILLPTYGQVLPRYGIGIV